jgi:hypothetical protein
MSRKAASGTVAFGRANGGFGRLRDSDTPTFIFLMVFHRHVETSRAVTIAVPELLSRTGSIWWRRENARPRHRRWHACAEVNTMTTTIRGCRNQSGRKLRE